MAKSRKQKKKIKRKIKRTKKIKKQKRRAKKRLKTSKKKIRPVRQKAQKIKKEPMASLLLPLNKVKEIFRTRYGFFLYDGSEYVVTGPDSPAPWANIITNNNYGFIVTQTGAGFSFKKTIADKVTSWGANLNTDRSGKFFYIRDNRTQEFFSASWNPVRKQPQFYEVRNGIGYTNITNKVNDTISSLVCFVAKEEPVEIWQLRVRNLQKEARSISIFSYLEWVFPGLLNKKDESFFKTSFNQGLSAIFAHSVNNSVKFHAVNKPVNSFTTDKQAFLGMYHDASHPRVVEKGMCFKEEGRYVDPAACLQIDLDFEPGGEHELIFIVGASSDEKTAQEIIKKYKNIKDVEAEFSSMGSRWGEYLKKSMVIKTPDEGANILNNNWFRYQAISGGLSAKGCYYQTDGLIRFRDFILNSLIFLPIDEQVTKNNIIECAKRQFADGNVLAWWDILSEKSQKSNYSDDCLWLVFAVCEYLKETASLSMLKEKIPYQDAAPETLFDHCLKAINKVADSVSSKGPSSGRMSMPVIMGGDCNRKLDGDEQNGSVWLGQFLCYITEEFSNVCASLKEDKLAAKLIKQIMPLKDKINKLKKGTQWYPRVITPKGAVIGRQDKKDGIMFLNTQSWAVISRLIQDEEAKDLMDLVAKNLYKNHGPIVLSPCYNTPNPEIGTITYLPCGIQENGGTNVVFACWAVWAEIMLKRAYNAWDIYSRLNPVHRAHRADIYEMEPYVSSCYIDGPDAGKLGQARNSWYGTSAFWLNKILTEHILGIKPTHKGLSIDPCIPARWKLFKVYRHFRGTRYVIDVINHRHISFGVAEITVDGKKIHSNTLPIFKDEKSHYVRVVMGRPA
ncbi:MAG: hypothetical protein JW946_02300 [Candidatus Omnitrophica bacterium]|nr:hypothetical protein [Candidatus Omnitrophota bacterium]